MVCGSCMVRFVLKVKVVSKVLNLQEHLSKEKKHAQPNEGKGEGGGPGTQNMRSQMRVNLEQ